MDDFAIQARDWLVLEDGDDGPGRDYRQPGAEPALEYGNSGSLF